MSGGFWSYKRPKIRPITTYAKVRLSPSVNAYLLPLQRTHGGVSTAYDQEIVFEMSLSNASPLAAWVICARVKAGG